MEASPTLELPPPGGDKIAGQAPSRLLAVQPDSVLCHLAMRGNSNAYDALYQRYRQPVFAFVFHLLNRRDGTEDAEDITQETFTRAFAGIRGKRQDGSFKHWLFTIARNRTFDDIRGRDKRTLSLDAGTLAEPATLKTATAEHAEQRVELAWLMTAVADLPDRQRDALLMRELGGLSHAEIAEQLGATVSATKKLINRGRDGVKDAASDAGYRSHRLSRELALAAPILPMAAAGIGISGAVAAGGTAAAAGGAAGVGGAMIGGKVVATVLTVVAIGGGAVAVEHKSDGSGPANAKSAESRAVTQRIQNTSALLPGVALGKELSGRNGGGADDRNGHGGSDRNGHHGENKATDDSLQSESHGGSSHKGGGSGESHGSDKSSELEAPESNSGKLKSTTPPADNSGKGNSGSGQSGSGSDDQTVEQPPSQNSGSGSGGSDHVED